jgi:hypothetical protein
MNKKQFKALPKTISFYSVQSEGNINDSVEGRNRLTRFVEANVASLLEGKEITLTDALFKKKYEGKGRVLVQNMMHNPEYGHFLDFEKIFKFTIVGNTLTVKK